MAEVIERFLSANYPCACEGDCPGEHAEAEELADALAKAGYGKLADAWDRGWWDGKGIPTVTGTGKPAEAGPPEYNPYRSES